MPSTWRVRPSPRKADRQTVRSKISGSVNASAQAPDELVIDAGVVEGEALGIGHGQPLLLTQLALVRGADGAVEGLLETLLPDFVGPKGEAHRALVELGDPDARCFTDAHGKDALVVGRVHQPHGRRSEGGLQRPDLHGVTTLSGRDVQAGHLLTLCRCPLSRPAALRELQGGTSAFEGCESGADPGHTKAPRCFTNRSAEALRSSSTWLWASSSWSAQSICRVTRRRSSRRSDRASS